MKVAILVSGQPRNYKIGYENLKKSYLDRYDCDVYLHTWAGGKFEATQFFKDKPKDVYEYSDNYLSEIKDMYKAKVFSVESPKVFDDKGIVDPLWRQPLQNSKSMWYSLYTSYKLIESKYDAVIRTRFDLQYEDSLLDLESLDLSKVHVWNWNTDERVKHRGYYDVFAISNQTNMGIYSQLYRKIDWYLNYDNNYPKFLQGGWPGQDSGLRNEYLLKWHLINSGLEVIEHPTKIEKADGQIIR